MAGITHQWLIDGQDFGPPVNWLDFEIQGTFAQENEDELIPENQPNLSIDRLEWSGRAAQYIANRFRGGLNGNKGAFIGPLVSWTIADNSGAYKAFDGYIDYSDGYRELDFKGPKRTDPNQVITKIVDDFGLNALLFAVNGVTMDLIADKFSDSDWTDINWVYVKKYDFIELLLLDLGIYILSKELAESILELQNAISDGINPPAGPLVFALKIAFLAVYIAFITIQLIELIRQIINILWPKLRTHKGVSLKTLLIKAFAYVGYELVTDIEELEFYTILPTLPTKKSNFSEEIFNKIRVTETGLPSINDFGFLFTEILTLCRRLFNARLAVINKAGSKEVHLHADGSDFWFKQSNLTLLNGVLVDEVGYNTDELFLNRYFRFQTDPLDDWSKEELKGTSFEVITTTQSADTETREVLGEEVDFRTAGQNSLVKGLQETFIPYSLGVLNKRNSLQQFIYNTAKAAEDTLSLLGTDSNFTAGLRLYNGALKVSNPEISVPKLLYIKEGIIPEDHRDKLGARYLMEKYHRTKSFVNYSEEEPFNNQYQTFEGVNIQFDLQKFLTLRNNSYFITDEGESGRIEDFKYNVSSDSGTFSGRFRNVYDKSLIEQTFELKSDDE